MDVMAGVNIPAGQLVVTGQKLVQAVIQKNGAPRPARKMDVTPQGMAMGEQLHVIHRQGNLLATPVALFATATTIMSATVKTMPVVLAARNVRSQPRAGPTCNVKLESA
jgi:hypothetical protein